MHKALRTLFDKPLTIHDLAVVDFYNQYARSDAAQEWRARSKVPFAESCARQIWYGHKDSFLDFPIDSIAPDKLTRSEGADAYRTLLRLNLGLLSQKKGETNITGQFQAGWKVLRDADPDAAAPYGKLIQHITGDSRLIRHHVLDGWKMKNSELCARDLSGMRANDSVLIIGHANSQGHISATTDNMARKVTGNAGRAAREVTITHPDPVILNNIFNDLSKSSKDGRIPAPIKRADFADLSLAVALHDRVYVTMPMEHDAQADDHIIACWRGREEKGNTLTHLRAKPEKAATTSQTWLDARLDNFISPDDILREMSVRETSNKELMARAERAIDHCIDMRVSSRQASARTLREAGIASSVPQLQEPSPPAPKCG